VQWTHLRPCDIALHLEKTYQEKVSHRCIKRILRANNYKYRKPGKTIAIGKSPDRATQFEIIFFIVALFMNIEHNPIISIDTKKKEVLGQLTRNQPVLSNGNKAPDVCDHDFSFLATGKVIADGIFDTKLNKGYISIGNSHETARFVMDNLDWWWQNYGQYLYPKATMILVCVIVVVPIGIGIIYSKNAYKTGLKK